MYAVCVNDDNTVSTLVNQRIYQGYQLSDWFWIFENQLYGNKKLIEYNSYIQFILPVSQKSITEKIYLKDECYEGYLKYSISQKSKLTKESGKVIAKVYFKDRTGNVVKESSEFEIKIATTDEWHNDDSFVESSDSNSGGNCDCNNEEYIKEILSRTKPLVFESENIAVSKLNSGTVSDIYYGQTVIIKVNDKYLPYTVQKGKSGYVVEPIDTVGDGTIDGLFWNEN